MFLFPLPKNHHFFGESIYNLIGSKAHEAEKERKSARYKSKHNSSVKEFYKSKKSSVPKTMGYPPCSGKKPHEYLRKHSGERKLAEGAKAVECLCRKPKKQSTLPCLSGSLPRLNDKFERNFIKENAVDAIKRPATTPARKTADSRRGDIIDLEDSGLVPKFCLKEEYGKTPKYVWDMRKNFEKSKKEFDSFIQSVTDVPRKMSEEEKEEIQNGLVANLNELLRKYLTLPLATESPLRIKRKVNLEKRMDALERDIALLNRSDDIFIGKSNPKI
ncbi:enkurin-like [Stegodyphus dumicola]|uniref:enkurin-like n=1 Tax=Stegodyphus dumicola TaxID=202533 RepID=UPI0015A77C13|nr:enkurin-like [Stegodyphus dumicola]